MTTLFHGQVIDFVRHSGHGAFLANFTQALAARRQRRGALRSCTVLSTGHVDKAESPVTAVTCVLIVNLHTAMTPN